MPEKWFAVTLTTQSLPQTQKEGKKLLCMSVYVLSQGHKQSVHKQRQANQSQS